MRGHNLILVPVDFSPEYRMVLEFADEKAVSSGSSLLLLHVVQFRDPMRQRPPEILMDPLDDLVRLIKKVPEARVAVLAVEGEPVQKILEAANFHKCNSIVMGRGGSVENPGHVALGVKKGFLGQVHWVSRFDIKVPAGKSNIG